MRRKIFLLVILAWLFSPAEAQRLSFGFKGGVDVTNMEFRNDMFDSSNRVGFFIGPTLLINTFVPGLSIDVSALYDDRTLKVEDEDVKQQTILLPGNVRYGVGIGNAAGIFLCAGPQLAFNVGASSFSWKDVENVDKYFSLQDTKLSMNFGLGITLGSHLEVSAYYNIPLGKTGDFTWETFNKQMSEQTLDYAKTTSNAWSMALSYRF